MIKVKKTDTIIDIISKINEEKTGNIILDFPLGHPILHNYVSLKILKTHCGRKRLIIVTPDITSRKIGKNLGIEYSLVKDSKFYEEKQEQGNILKHNFSFSEYLIFELKKYAKKTKRFFIDNKNIKYYTSKYQKQQSRIGFFLVGLIISIFLFLFIFYFAVTKTYITITPEVKVKTRGKNFVFQESAKESILLPENIIPLVKVSKMISLEENFGATGIDSSKIKKSSGMIRLINKTDEEVNLMEKTRLQAKNGVIFEINNWVKIPASEGNKAGTIDVKITSQIKDVKGVTIGENANIDTKEILSIPGLQENKDDIYAISLEKFTGGENYVDKKNISNEDIENAKKVLEEKLKTESLKELRKQIKNDNIANNVTYEILGINDIIFYKNLEITIPEDVKIGDNKNSFILKGKIEIEAYTYNKNSVITKLKKVINESTIEGSEKILLIDEGSLRVATEIYRQEKPFEVKATLEVESFIIHNFLNDNDNYVQKLKSTILGFSKEEATNVLLNDPKISNVKIDITPFFMDKISNISDNIIFKVSDTL
ncbi:hypothetical protein HGA92_05390 [Candidatus Gracilibacteria bacterium]|nr:hypothetical protein [Candidatus Gracilibacteria bacterium]NUJ99066.1 hypothetical protein [Candidatus Gracilibacteria bacterium]